MQSHYSISGIVAESGATRIAVQKAVERGQFPTFQKRTHRTAAHAIPAEFAEQWISKFKARKERRTADAIPAQS